jgi:hypothetical protein
MKLIEEELVMHCDIPLHVAGETVDEDGVRHLVVSTVSIADFAAHVSSLEREAVASWLERQPLALTPAEAAAAIRKLRADH